MAFNSIRPTADAEDVEQIINALTGVSGAGQLISLTQVNDSSNYALDVRNLDTTNSYGLRVRDASSNNLLLAYKNAVVLGASAANDALTINCNISGKVYIGDSANANMTTGLTINQGGADNEIVSLQSSDVATGMTTLTETDVYGAFMKYNGATGGLGIYGYLGGATNNGALSLYGYQAAAADTTKSIVSSGIARIQVGVKSGTTVTNAGANANLFTITNYDATRFIFDAEGDMHCDAGGGAGNTGNIGGIDAGGNASPNQTITGYNTYDEFDDVQLVRVLEVERNGRGLVEHGFDAFLHYNRADLERLNLAHFGDDGHTFVNYTGLARLHSGAIWQMWTRMQDGLARLALVEQRIAALPGAN